MRAKVFTATALSLLFSVGTVMAQAPGSGSPTGTGTGSDGNGATVAPNTPGAINGGSGTGVQPLDPNTTGSVNQNGRDCTLEDELDSNAQNDMSATQQQTAEADDQC